MRAGGSARGGTRRAERPSPSARSHRDHARRRGRGSRTPVFARGVGATGPSARRPACSGHQSVRRPTGAYQCVALPKGRGRGGLPGPLPRALPRVPAAGAARPGGRASGRRTGPGTRSGARTASPSEGATGSDRPARARARGGFAVLAPPGDAPGGAVGALRGVRRIRGGQAGQASWTRSGRAGHALTGTGRAAGLLPGADRAERGTPGRLRVLGRLAAQHAFGVRRTAGRPARPGRRGRCFGPGRRAVRTVVVRAAARARTRTHAREPTHPRRAAVRHTKYATGAATASAVSSGSTGCPPCTPPTARTEAYSRRGASQRWERASRAAW